MSDTADPTAHRRVRAENNVTDRPDYGGADGLPPRPADAARAEPDRTGAPPEEVSEEAAVGEASDRDDVADHPQADLPVWDASSWTFDSLRPVRLQFHRQFQDLVTPAWPHQFHNLLRTINGSAALTRALRKFAGSQVQEVPHFAVPQFDFGDLLGTRRLVETAHISLRSFDFAAWERTSTAWRPPNWPDDVDCAVLEEIVNDEGLPVVWVPRAEVLARMLRAADRTERVGLLMANAVSLVEDCVGVLPELTHKDLSGQVPLANAALAAWRAGQTEGAQALAVVVIDSALRAVFENAGNYKQFGEDARIDFEDAPAMHIKALCALAPIAAFYTPWWPKSGSPPPAVLSRHVSIHQATAQQYKPKHSLVAVLLMTSVLRGLHEILADHDARRT